MAVRDPDGRLVKLETRGS